MGAGDQSCEAVPLQKLSFLRIPPFFYLPQRKSFYYVEFFSSLPLALYLKKEKVPNIFRL
jgi:hypothetical protein